METKLPPSAIESSAEMKAMMADLAALRTDVAKLAGRLKTNAMSSAENAAGQISDEATRLMDSMSGAGKSSVHAIERQVDAHPLVSLMLAFSVGFIGSRLLSK